MNRKQQPGSSEGKYLDGCNPNTGGMEEAMNILQLGIDTLMKIKGKISGIFVGAAGLDSGNNTSKIKKMLKEKYPERQIKIMDSLAASMGEGLLLYYAVKLRVHALSPFSYGQMPT